MLGNVLLLSLLQEPLLGRVGVGDGLRSGEGLGGDEEEGGLRVRVSESFGHVRAINVGDEVEGHAAVAIVLERFSDHDWAAIGC